MLEQALELHQRGELGPATALYEQVLAGVPDDFTALHQLGVIANQEGRFEAAAALLLRALGLRPKSALGHLNLGISMWHLDRKEEALSHYQYALVLSPNHPDALLNAAVALHGLQRGEEALPRLERLLTLQEHVPEALLNRGIVLQELRRFAEALASFDELLTLRPDHPEGLMNRGNALLGLGRAGEALADCERALALKPGDPEILVNRGNALLDLERFEAALASFDQALERRPDFVAALSNRANALRHLNRNLEALASCQRALALDPDHLDALLNQGTALYLLARPQEAIASFDRSLALKPDFAAAHSNKIFVLDYLPDLGFEAHQAARRQFFSAQAAALPVPDRHHANDRDPGRKLVLGYVSADFKHHSAASCFGPVLKRHDKSRFRVVCYSGVIHEDDWTREFRASADAWRSTLGVSDEALAAQIQADGVDILIDLAGHSRDSRLLVFARKPAPVQVTAWGHGGGTGLPTIDYQFTDPVFTPEGARPLFAEASYDLPCCITYEPPPDLPAVAELPAISKGHVTFGSFNRFNKITPAVLGLWADILRAVPESRILLKSSGLDDAATQSSVRALFLDRSLEPDRVELRGTSSQQAHLAAHHEVDIHLDTHPQSGGITTFEALWMGVPVLTLLGPATPGRVSGAILHAFGLDDWISETESGYLERAVAKAADLASLAVLRRELRARILASPAGNPEGYTRAVEAAYRAMWRRWLAS